MRRQKFILADSSDMLKIFMRKSFMEFHPYNLIRWDSYAVAIWGDKDIGIANKENGL